jgi:hypothetical protein
MQNGYKFVTEYSMFVTDCQGETGNMLQKRQKRIENSTFLPGWTQYPVWLQK